MPRIAIAQLAKLIGQELESRVGPSDWPDTLPGAAAGPPHLLMPLLHDQRGRQRFLGLETVPVLAERTLPAPYPPDKMIFPAAQRPPGSSSQWTPSWRKGDSNSRSHPDGELTSASF